MTAVHIYDIQDASSPAVIISEGYIFYILYTPHILCLGLDIEQYQFNRKFSHEHVARRRPYWLCGLWGAAQIQKIQNVLPCLHSRFQYENIYLL